MPEAGKRATLLLLPAMRDPARPNSPFPLSPLALAPSLSLSFLFLPLLPSSPSSSLLTSLPPPPHALAFVLLLLPTHSSAGRIPVVVCCSWSAASGTVDRQALFDSLPRRLVCVCVRARSPTQLDDDDDSFFSFVTAPPPPPPPPHFLLHRPPHQHRRHHHHPHHHFTLPTMDAEDATAAL